MAGQEKNAGTGTGLSTEVETMRAYYTVYLKERLAQLTGVSDSGAGNAPTSSPAPRSGGLKDLFGDM